MPQAVVEVVLTQEQLESIPTVVILAEMVRRFDLSEEDRRDLAERILALDSE